jgi:hypothetical protein
MLSAAARTLQDRTDAKMRYAEVHLRELQDYGPLDGSDFDKAHEESFLMHLFGTRDALLAELNEYYSAGLPAHEVRPGKLFEALGRAGKQCTELARLHALDQDNTSWFSFAKVMRDHAEHRAGMSRDFQIIIGPQAQRRVRLRVPSTGQLIDENFPDLFHHWLQEMRQLVAELRASAMTTCGLS